MSTPLLDEITALTCDLIAFESIDTRQDEIAAAVDYVERYARAIPGLHLERIESNGVPSLVVAFHETRSPAFLLNAHLDVVPGLPAQFHPEISAGRIYGRGAQDMKGSAAVLMRLMRDLAALPERPDVAFQFVGDEEIGGLNGTRVLLEERGWNCGFFLVAEPTDLQICYAHKGAMWVDVTIKGRPSHGSRPWDGSNPIRAIGAGLASIEQFYPTLDEPAWMTTVTPTKLISGDAGNRLPDAAKLTFDIRFVPEEDPQQILRVLHEAFPGAHIDGRAPADPLHTDPNDPQVQQLAQRITVVTGVQAGFFREHFATDARFYSSAGIPAVCLGPIGAGLHSDEEWVDIASLGQTYDILRRFVLG
ncbi:MAG: M20/M25/M40 family metallo-hydrolase [Roseiflexaceae bacterium]|nr:M20/M25/M40 family metallo-hydrolase [Roseiflexaceae bacterium]